MEISGGVKEDGVVVGNAYDKYGSDNPIVKWMMNGFHESLKSMVDSNKIESILDVGCGEGYWVLQWAAEGKQARGIEFSFHVVELAKGNATGAGVSPDVFEQGSIYDLDREKDSADLIVCCEVLEHLEFPEKGLTALQQIHFKNLILSVPSEPIWRLLNMARGKYLKQFGNTPGHLQHWSKKKFIELVSQYFEIVEVKSPFPWTMVLCRPRSL